MFINLTDYFESQGKKAEVKIPLEAESFDCNGTMFPVISKEDLILSIENVGEGRLELRGTMNLHLEGSCDRCLSPVDIPLNLNFDYLVNKPDGYHELSEDEATFMEGFELNAEAFIYNELIMSLPMKVLCKETCKGLCPVCGKNRNVVACNCDTFVPDPRMAAIKDIFNANKEV